VVGRAGSDPGLVIAIAANVVVELGKGRIRIDRAEVRHADHGRNQHCGSVHFPRNRFVVVEESAEDGPSGTSVGGDEKWGYAIAEASGEHLRGVDRIDRDARLGILIGFGAVVLRENVNHAENDGKIGRCRHRSCVNPRYTMCQP
jgi:hypothetical protein